MSDNAIGIRVSPQEIFYTIIEKQDDKQSYFIEKVVVPKAIDFPRKLSYIRTTLFSLICEYNVTRAGLRTSEGSAQTLSIERVNIEGVIQELFSNSTVESYFTGTSTSIGSRLDSTRTDIKECYEGKKNLFEVEGWESMNDNYRESYLAALASLQN